MIGALIEAVRERDGPARLPLVSSGPVSSTNHTRFLLLSVLWKTLLWWFSSVNMPFV